jgi:RimJ/RimL family protein N-acetyltransferase
MTDQNSIIWRKGQKVILRPLETGDAPYVYRWINDPETNQYLATTGPKGFGFEEAWIESKQKPSTTDITVGICTHTGELIGTMGLHNIDPINRTAITGTLIGEEKYRGGGYGTDAKMLLLDYAFNFIGLHVVESRVIGFNDRSASYSKKCGYVEEARLRSRFYRFGERHDEIILSVTHDDWLHLWKKYQKDLPTK